MKVQPYARVSTDDKDPRRQLPGLAAWCEREGAEALPPVHAMEVA